MRKKLHIEAHRFYEVIQLGSLMRLPTKLGITANADFGIIVNLPFKTKSQLLKILQEIKMIQKFNTLEEAKKVYDTEKSNYDELNIIKSNGAYYVEDGIPLLRSHEQLIKKNRK